MLQELITPSSTTDKSLYLEGIFLLNGKYDLKFKRICLK